MFRTTARAIATGALFLTGLVSLAAPAAADPPTPTELASALDAPGTVSVTAPSDPLSYGTVTTGFNDLPSNQSSYVVLSTGKAADVFSSTVPNDQPSTDLGTA
ncbi:MAG: hypothetical protein ABIN55_05225, partial [Aeromicrobium sp.]